MRIQHRCETKFKIFFFFFIFYIFTGSFTVCLSNPLDLKGQSILEKGKNYFYEQKYDQTVRTLLPMANDKNSEAQYYLALAYRAQEQFGKAFDWFMKSANNGNSDAYFEIGLMYGNGEGVEMSPLIAMDWHRKAQLSGITPLGSKQIKFYDDNQEGTSKQVKPSVIFEKKKKAAENGDIEAQYSVAQQLDFGILVTRNFAQALKWYKHAAENGHQEAQFLLGYFYCRGLGVDQNKKLANKWLIKSGLKTCCEK